MRTFQSRRGAFEQDRGQISDEHFYQLRFEDFMRDIVPVVSVHRFSSWALFKRNVRDVFLFVVSCGIVAFLVPEFVFSQQMARISEEIRSIKTYSYSEPNPIPILTRNVRLYPYHSFERYSHKAVPRDWRVVKLENDFIEVFVLPEVGGKIWGAVVKATGHEFIYRNEVMKFRNIAMRGPWTSGGIEFNFGRIGHTPSTATPVDYRLIEEPDGSVSCVVGAMDLSSRTTWRVKIRLPADRAAFETHALWHNPTPLVQPYYNWMTAAAFATDDLEMTIPGTAYLEHSGHAHRWPSDEQGRLLSKYANNTFAGNKSFHVVGEMADFFGGYYHDADYGFGHWSRYEDMPGQKLWLWALSPEGGIWKNLLTDNDGQYVEYQAGRLFVQYQSGLDSNPIKQVGFAPGTTDRWREVWFPLEGTGGLSQASDRGALYAKRTENTLSIWVTSFGSESGSLEIRTDAGRVFADEFDLAPLGVYQATVDLPRNSDYEISVPELGLHYQSNPEANRLDRSFETTVEVENAVPETDRLLTEGLELMKGGLYGEARSSIERALTMSPSNRRALIALADLEYRRGRYHGGLAQVRKALQLGTYAADANFIAGNLYHALDARTDAREAYGWAARSMAYRSAAYTQLAVLDLADGHPDDALRHARAALDYDQYNLKALDEIAIAARLNGDQERAEKALSRLETIDPLHHLVFFERYLWNRTPSNYAAFENLNRSEYPDQTFLELAIAYHLCGADEEAVELLQKSAAKTDNPIVGLWLAYLTRHEIGATDYEKLAASHPKRLVFPYRPETLKVLQWVVNENTRWEWRYLLALNLWALDREPEVLQMLQALGDEPNYAAFYASRAYLEEPTDPQSAEADFIRAQTFAEADRLFELELVKFYQRHARWQEALAASETARERHSDDFNLAILHAKSLLYLHRPEEALKLLDQTDVLPSEHVRESHQLYEDAHLMAGLARLAQGGSDPSSSGLHEPTEEGLAAARAHFQASLEWPEHLGSGKPYDPEDRLARFLIAYCDDRLGRAEEAQRGLLDVVERTRRNLVPSSDLHALAFASLRLLDRPEEEASLRDAAQASDPEVSRRLDGDAAILEKEDLRDVFLKTAIRLTAED